MFINPILWLITGSDQASSLVAFLLAMLCNLVQQVQERIEDTVSHLSLSTIKTGDINGSVVKLNGTHDVEKPHTSNQTLLENSHHDKGSGDSAVDGLTNKGHSVKPKKLRKIVRRRQRQGSSSDDSELSNGKRCLK